MDNLGEKELFSYINIRDYLMRDNEAEVGEKELEEILSDFSCPGNLDVENFLKKNAIEFTKKHQSVTYLVFSNDDATLVGYFTIALKPLIVEGESVSRNVRKKLARISEVEEESQSYMMAAFLIAQLGKNFTEHANEKITGDELLALAIEIIMEIRYEIGGVVTFLEAEPKEKLLDFYSKDANGFRAFSTRTSGGISAEHKLVRLLKILR